MKHRVRRIVRKFSIWLYNRTGKWVVPSVIWSKLDNGDTTAEIELSDIAVKWGTLDPEFIRANSMLRRIEYHKQAKNELEYYAQNEFSNLKYIQK